MSAEQKSQGPFRDAARSVLQKNMDGENYESNSG